MGKGRKKTLDNMLLPNSLQGMFLVMVLAILATMARRQLFASTSGPTVALSAAGLVMYALGGVTWNVDNHFCRRLGLLRSPPAGAEGGSPFPPPLRQVARHSIQTHSQLYCKSRGHGI